MLNKLNFYRELHQRKIAFSQSEQTEYGDNSITVLKSFFHNHGIDALIESYGSGTLGITYIARSKSHRPIFVKTHLHGEAYQMALRKEYRLLKNIYGDALSVEAVDINNQTYLLEDCLCKPSRDITPEIAMSILSTVQKRVEILDTPSIRGWYSIEDVLEAAEKELSVLVENGLLSLGIFDQIALSLSELKKHLPDIPKCICHGDFSDKNIMQDKNGLLVAIDWEDAFWGIPGYDYLYWLTFFNHRKYYSKDRFCITGYNTKFIEGILMMILVIKSAISFYNGSYLNNSLTIQQRMIECFKVLEVPGYDK